MRDTGFLLCIGIRNFRTKPLSSFCVEVFVSSVASVIVDLFVPELVPDVVSFPVDSLLSSCVEVDVPAVASVAVDVFVPELVPDVVSSPVDLDIWSPPDDSTVRPEPPRYEFQVFTPLVLVDFVVLLLTLSSFSLAMTICSISY